MVVQWKWQDAIVDIMMADGYRIEICVSCYMKLLGAWPTSGSPCTVCSREHQGCSRRFDCPSCLTRYIGDDRSRLQLALLALSRRADNQQDTSRH